MVGWTKTKTCLQQSTLSPKSLWPETLSSPDQLVCWGVSLITSVFWDIRLRMWKHLYFQVRLTDFAPPLLFQRHWRHEVVQVTTLLYRFSWERVPCFVVICMLLPCILCTEWSVTTPPPPPPNTYLKNSQTSGSLLWSKSLHKHLRGFLSSGVKASWWYIWLTSPTRATNFFRNLTRILNSSVCNFGPGNAWLF